MAELAAIQAERRSEAGKGVARALRRYGKVPVWFTVVMRLRLTLRWRQH